MHGWVDVTENLLIDLCKQGKRPWALVVKDGVPDDAVVTGVEHIPEQGILRIIFSTEAGKGGMYSVEHGKITTRPWLDRLLRLFGGREWWSRDTR